MIEFTGLITGDAKKMCIKRARRLTIYVVLFSCFLVLSPIILSSIKNGNYNVVYVSLGCILFFCFLIFLPQPKKTLKNILPSKIFTDGETIICMTEKQIETVFVDSVKTVVDYGEFYVLKFPFGKIKDKFICQKDLLTKGTLEEFEALFEGKIIIKTKTISNNQGKQSGDGPKPLKK